MMNNISEDISLASDVYLFGLLILWVSTSDILFEKYPKLFWSNLFYFGNCMVYYVIIYVN